jgi:acyl dehydratase
MSTVIDAETYPVTAEAIVRYAGASGDFTPIHYDGDVLAAAGYDTFFAMGMLVAGRLGALVARTYGDDAVREISVRFRERSWVGTEVTVELTATDDPDVVALEARTSSGSVVATGSARVARA